MKRAIFRLTLLLSVFFAATTPAIADMNGRCGDNMTWNLSKDGVLTISGSGMMNDFGSGNTPWRPELVRFLELADGVEHIGRNAFARTTILTASIPQSVKTIGEKAFYNCSRLSTVELPYGLETIGRLAFSKCGSLANIKLPSTLRNIGVKAFAGCGSITAISIPAKLKGLGVEAFAKCVALKKIDELPNFVSATNCSRFGLPERLVADYIESASKQYGPAVASAESGTAKPEAPKATAPRTSTQTRREGALPVAVAEYGKSDVDNALPMVPQNNSNTFAIIIANEKYANMADVPYAGNDGTSFAAYCRSVLGLPDTNISLYKDASYGTMRAALSYLRDIDAAFDGDISVIFYYAGHGAPDDASREAFLVPVDAHAPVKDVCLPLSELYETLGGLKAEAVKVFLDACFSGATRNSDMIAQARSVAVVPKVSPLKGNTVVFSAASDDQTAWQLDTQGHGLFTYYLLKKLKETRGEVSMGELSDYLSQKVRQASIVVNRKSQVPGVAASTAVSRKWRSWQVK